jgi:hypothetical protein
LPTSAIGSGSYTCHRVLIVVGSLARSTLAERRKKREED